MTSKRYLELDSEPVAKSRPGHQESKHHDRETSTSPAVKNLPAETVDKRPDQELPYPYLNLSHDFVQQSRFALSTGIQDELA